MKKLLFNTKPQVELVPPNHPSLPPGPPQMNNPVGPPPAPVELPRTYEECVERARMAAGGQIEKAHLWAILAQAHAAKLVADKLDALNEYIGAYDEADPDEQEEGDPLDSRFADAITEGILGAVSVVKDDLLSNAVIQMALAAAQRGVTQGLAQAEQENGEKP